MRWLVTHILLLSIWLWLHTGALSWMVGAWLRTEGHLHLILALLLLAGAARRIDPVAVLDRLAAPPRRSGAALALAVAPPLLAAVLQRWLPLHLVAGSALVASAYGIAGLFLGAAAWRRLRGAALLGAALLPLTEHLDVVLGFPLRAATAALVASLLGGAEVTAATVLSIDGAYAHVDLPCSGVRSLWSGAVVLLGAAVAWGRPVGARFATIAAGVAALLFAANTARVVIIVALTHLAGLPLLAEIVHVPLGVIGFLLALGVGLGLLHTWGGAAAHTTEAQTRWPAAAWGWALGLALATALQLWPAPRSLPVALAPAPSFPDDLIALGADHEELAFAEQHGASVRKARFERAGHTGTVVAVASRSWLAHHVPEQCLTSDGWSLLTDHPARVGGGPVRFARVERDGATATALWWYQSATLRTDDHTVRILDGLAHDTPWVLVSVLVDGAAEPSDPAVHGLVDDLYASVAHTLEET